MQITLFIFVGERWPIIERFLVGLRRPHVPQIAIKRLSPYSTDQPRQHVLAEICEAIGW